MRVQELDRSSAAREPEHMLLIALAIVGLLVAIDVRDLAHRRRT